MGKGYNNYMTKKPFHPGSKANIKRTWMAEQRTENEKRKQEELKTQYDKEQDLYNNRALLSTESKDKLQLNFMYEAPPGAKRERQKEDDEPEYKFEWQRKYNAPREDYAKGNSEIRDQPFGIPVRNVRCIKCHKWGHINTDKECPLFTHASTSSMPTTSMDPLELMRQMREDGYDLKRSALGHQVNPKQANEQFIPSDHSDPEMEFLKTLSSKQKKKLLKKLNKLSKKQQKKEDQKKKKGKKKSKKRASDSDPESERESKKRRKKIKSEPSSSESDSSEEDEKPILKDKKAKETSNKGSKKLLSPQSSKHEKNHKQKSKHKTASKDNLEYEEKSHKVILSKSTTVDKVKRTANDTKTEKSKEEKPSSEATASDTQKKDQSDKQDTNLSKEVLPQPSSSISQTTRVKIKVSGGSSSDTSDIRDKKISDVSDIRDKKSSDVSDTRDRSSKRLKVESPSSESRIFLKPDQSLPTTSRITEATVSDLPSSSRDDNLNQVGLHPDGFDPDHPQRTPGATSSHNPRKQDQNLHQRFREHHRHRRSPSVKHKYRND